MVRDSVRCFATLVFSFNVRTALLSMGICALLAGLCISNGPPQLAAPNKTTETAGKEKVKVRFVSRPKEQKKSPASKDAKPKHGENVKTSADRDKPTSPIVPASTSSEADSDPKSVSGSKSPTAATAARTIADTAVIEPSLLGENPDADTTSNATSSKTSTGKEILKLRLEQAKDSGECPGGSDATKPIESSEEDVPLIQMEHPFDAPAATSQNSKLEPAEPEFGQGKLSSAEIVLRHRINDCLKYYLENPESVTRRSPWAVMHATLPFGVETELVAGNRRVNAIGWMCYNGLCKTQRLFQPTRTGFRTNIGPGVQGHEGQLLAILAQSHVSPRHPIRIGNANYTVFDLARVEMATCREKSELTFKLIGLSYYLESDYRWRDNQGKTWSLEKLVAEELQQPIIGAACGGTHRLMGFSYALAQRKYARLPITGHWLRAEQFLNDFVSYALSLQNPDGSFSTEWFEQRSNEPNLEKKVQTTGHILEWLVFTVPESQLKSEPIQRALKFLLDNVSDNRQHNWPIGPRGHSLRALALYNQRIFHASPGNLREHLASLHQTSELR